MINQLIKEPLLHFLLIGVALFALFGIVGESENKQENRIVVSQADVDRLVVTWQKRWNRLPTPSEINNLVESYIREEILYREAVAMGLEKDDSVVRRRMAQKIEFLFKDIATPPKPSDEQLQAYLDNNSKKFTTAARYSFSHVYFSVDKRGEKVLDEAKQLLAHLQSDPGHIDITQMGDVFMFDYQFTNVKDFEVARLFGEKFVYALNGLDSGQWSGPVDSGYGVHLVLVQERVDPIVPALTEVRDRVKMEYIAEQQRDANQMFYESMRERYDIAIEGVTEKSESVALDAEQKGVMTQ